MRDLALTAATHDVLIVGAGPVGLALANDLRRRGIRCRIIDSAPQAAQQTKAVGIQAKALGLLAKMGAAHTAIERGLKLPVFRLSSVGKRATSVDFRQHLIESPYPCELIRPQEVKEQT